jgi:hypothetical protein
MTIGLIFNSIKLLFTNKASRTEAPIDETLVWRLVKVDALSETDLLILIIKYSVVIGEEVETKDPIWLMRTVHKLNNTLVILRSTLKPLVAVYPVFNSIDREVNVRNSLVLLFSAITHCQGIFKLLALEFILEEMVVDA